MIQVLIQVSSSYWSFSLPRFGLKPFYNLHCNRRYTNKAELNSIEREILGNVVAFLLLSADLRFGIKTETFCPEIKFSRKILNPEK